MHHLSALAPQCAFLLLAMLAGLVSALGWGGRFAPQATPLALGAAVFLGQVAGCVALAGLGLPVGIAQGAALALGTAVAWTEA